MWWLLWLMSCRLLDLLAAVLSVCIPLNSSSYLFSDSIVLRMLEFQQPWAKRFISHPRSYLKFKQINKTRNASFVMENVKISRSFPNWYFKLISPLAESDIQADEVEIQLCLHGVADSRRYISQVPADVYRKTSSTLSTSNEWTIIEFRWCGGWMFLYSDMPRNEDSVGNKTDWMSCGWWVQLNRTSLDGRRERSKLRFNLEIFD